jgi:hypothetical protein
VQLLLNHPMSFYCIKPRSVWLIASIDIQILM